MSVFVTTLGATDNEICAPISQCIINSLTNHGFRFKGIPAVEANICVRENKVDFLLQACCLKAATFSLSFDEVASQTRAFKDSNDLHEVTMSKVKQGLQELNERIHRDSRCKGQHSCANCVIN